jgi:ATP-dependent RNA helicase DDX54/DBP10
MSPTRELALQTADVVRVLGKFTDIRACLLIGGDNLEDQVCFSAARNSRQFVFNANQLLLLLLLLVLL